MLAVNQTFLILVSCDACFSTMIRNILYKNIASANVSTVHRPNTNVHKVIFACSQVKNGHIKCVMDEEIKSLAIEVQGINTR